MLADPLFFRLLIHVLRLLLRLRRHGYVVVADGREDVLRQCMHTDAAHVSCAGHAQLLHLIGQRGLAVDNLLTAVQLRLALVATLIEIEVVGMVDVIGASGHAATTYNFRALILRRQVLNCAIADGMLLLLLLPLHCILVLLHGVLRRVLAHVLLVRLQRKRIVTSHDVSFELIIVNLFHWRFSIIMIIMIDSDHAFRCD